MIQTAILVCFYALVMTSVAIYITASIIPKDIAKIISVPDVLFLRNNIGRQNFKVQYLIYRCYHISPISKVLHDVSFLSDAFFWLALGNHFHVGISVILLSVMIYQVVDLSRDEVGVITDEDRLFTKTASVIYTIIFLLSYLLPTRWELIITGLLVGTLARVFGHNEESLIPPMSFSSSDNTDKKFGPKAERNPYFLAGIFALPICAGAEFMSGIPGRLLICTLYDFYMKYSESRMFGLTSEQVEEYLADFKEKGLDTDVKEIRSLSTLEPGHHYKENDEIPSTWKAILMVEPIIISLCILPKLMSNFDSNISSHQNLMLLSVMAWFFVLLNYLILIHYPSVRLVSGIQKANLFFNLWVIGVMLGNPVLLSNVLLFHLQLCMPLLCTAIRLIFLHSVAFDSGIMHKDVMQIRKS